MIILTVLGLVVVDACPVVTSVNGSCCEIKSNDFKFSTTMMKSRVYYITNFCGDCQAVTEGYCDGVSDGGGWLVVQRRQDGSVDFDRSWVEYEEGFGDLDGNFWYRLRPLHCLTNQGQWQLRIDFTFTNGTKSYLFYDKFAVGPASGQYVLSISGFSAITTDDPFTTLPLNGMKFTTKDRDNDLYSSANCATDRGAWWHNGCTHLHLHHHYKDIYVALNGMANHISFTEMKIKPKKCPN